ncbi:unnamed protein product, partial [Closterium sp. NIES-53]
MALRPSSVRLRVPLPLPPESSLPAVPDPESDRARAASPTVSRLIATVVTDPSFESSVASALVAELLDFAAACCLDYATALVAESESASPPSVGGECALGTDVLEDRQEEFECLAAAVPCFAFMLLSREGDPNAPDIPTPRSYAKAITGPYSSQWQAAMDAEMASWKSTGTYVDAVPPPGANIVDGMWIFRVKRPPGSSPAFKARYVAQGCSQQQGVDYFQTFSPTPKMTTLWVLLHVAVQRDYDLHSLDFSTDFLQGSLHEEIWLRRPPSFTGSFPVGTQWSLRQPLYGLHRAPREWHNTLRTRLAALGFTPSTADPSLFLRTDTSLPLFYILVYVHDLVFGTADTEALTLVMSELQKRHTCTDLGELRNYLGLQITWDRARRTIKLTLSHMGYIFSVGSGSVSWRSTCSSSVLSSSCEAEIYAGAMAAQELRWLTYPLTDLGERPCSSPVLYSDNKAMIALCQEHIMEHRTKHIALRYVLARELQHRGQLCLAYVATRANTADIFTKALQSGDHQPCFSFLDWSCDRLFSLTLLMEFPDATEIPRWGDLSRAGVAIFDLDYDVILAAMYALSTSDEGDCYLCVPPDPGIEAAALGAGETAALGASASAALGAGESAPSRTASAQVLHTFTLDSGASRSFFRDRTTLTPLSRPVAVSLADPSGGPVLASFSTVLPCPAAPSGSLSGLYLPSFSTNLVSGADLQDQGVDQFTPASQRVTHCTCARTGCHLAMFTRRPGSSLYTLSTASPPVPASGQVAASSQVFAAASGSGPESAPCSCRLLSHQTLLLHHRLGHPSLPRLRGMASRVLVSGLPRSLPPLPPGPAPTCVPCVEGRQRAAPHSSEFPPTEAPLQTLHMDVWGPARVRGQGHERYFLLVVDDYSHYTTVFPLRSKGEVTEVLIDSIRAARLRLRQSFGSDFVWSTRVVSRAAGPGGAAEATGVGGTTAATGSGGTCPGGAGAAGSGGPAEAAGVGPLGGSAGASGGTGAAGSPGTGAAGATGVGAGGSADAGTSEGAGVGATGAGGAAGTGAPTRSPGAVPVGSGGATRPRPYFVPLLEQSQLQPVSPLPAPSPYTGPTGGLAERCAPASRPASPARPACTSRRTSRPRPPPVPGTHQMTQRPSTAPLRVPLPSPPASSLPVLADPESDSLHDASPTVACFLATVVTDPSLASTAASALVAELVDFAACCRLDYAASLVAESESVCPPSVGGECALSTDVLEDRQEEFQCFAAALPHLVSTLLAPEGDPDAPDIPTPRSYAEAIEGPYSSQWQAAMDAEMASWKSTGTYVDEVPPRGANIVSAMWIFRVKRPPGSPPVFKARYVARGFSQRQGVDHFQTFSPTPKMTTLRVLLHVAAQRDYELHSLDFSTAFLQGSLHEEIWLRRPPSFTGSFPPGTQWSLRRPVYGLRQAPREWHDTLRTTLAALGFAPSTADPSLFLRTDTSLPPFYVLVYVLQRFGFTYSSPQATPLPTRHSLSALPSDESVEPSGPYPELVGCLMYLMTCTRPDLAYPLSILARYVALGRHRPEHMAAAKRVLRYLCSTSGIGLVLGGRRPVVLTGHADASWADDQTTQRSSQGYTFSLGSGSVSWRSTRSSSVLSSSCEAEIYAGAMAAQELRWLTYLLTDLGEQPRSAPVPYVDNKAMLALCREHRLEHRTKHIALRYFLARELQQRGQLRLAYVASEANTADIFTKALPPGDHQRFCTMLACFALLDWSCDLLFSPTLPMG